MAFMKLQTVRKGSLYSVDCSHCGCTNYWHEWIDDGQGSELHTYQCDECGKPIDADEDDVFRQEGMYASRYSAPGYMDCTEWSYGPNLEALETEVREMYGDDDDGDDGENETFPE